MTGDRHTNFYIEVDYKCTNKFGMEHFLYGNNYKDGASVKI
jgi:hypothetical protein